MSKDSKTRAFAREVRSNVEGLQEEGNGARAR